MMGEIILIVLYCIVIIHDNQKRACHTLLLIASDISFSTFPLKCRIITAMYER